MRRFLVLVPCAVAAVLTSACGPLGGTTGTAGELGNGVFSYACSSPSDATCDSQSGPLPMPKGIAVGGRFTVTYSPTAVSEDKGSAIVHSVSKDLITDAAGLGSQFQAVKPGTAGLLAMRGMEVIDIVHVEIAPVDAIRIDSDTTGSEIQDLKLQAGESATLRAIPLSPGKEELAGALDCTWSAQGSSVMLGSATDDNVMTIQALANGATTLTIKLGDKSAALPVTVGDVSQTGSGGAGGAGTGGSGGAGGTGGGV